jgi:hypothetical protein
MPTPEMKQEYDLSPADFGRHPIWVGVHNFDSDEPWYEQADEETFRPWTGPLPFAETRGFVLAAATFELADGTIYPGYCRSVGDHWDAPFEPLPMAEGTPNKRQSKAVSKVQSWSSMHGGNQLSVLLLQSPIIFVSGHRYDFQLRIPSLRKSAIQSFYAAIGKKPSDVFPLRFAANSGLAAGVTSGKLDGFYSFPLSKTTPKTESKANFEIDTGEAFLREEEEASDEGLVPVANNERAAIPAKAAKQELERDDFQLHAVWVVVPFPDDTKPPNAQFTFVPWTGSLPVDPEKIDARIPGTFVLRDGSQLPGYVRPVPENWADIIPATKKIGRTVFPGVSSKVRYGGSPLAIVGEQRPCVFIAGQTFPFWCGGKDPDELRRQFYKLLRKRPKDIFPIRFEGAPGLATGVVSGEMNGFYLLSWPNGKPRIYVEA